MFQICIFCFDNVLQNSLQKSLQFIVLVFFREFTKIEIKSFECPKAEEIVKENNAWQNIRHLVDESFVPANQ